MSNLVLLGRNLLEKGLNKFVKLMISIAWKVSKMLITTIKYLEIFERIRKFYTWMYPFKSWKYSDKFYPRTSKNDIKFKF